MKFERYGIGIAKGLSVTIRYLFRRPITTQYPEQRLNTARRIRGNELIWSREKCTGCATCAKTCPQGVIHIETSEGDANSYVVDRFEVDVGYCIFCGLCVESCPYAALFMDYGYERSRYRRQEMVLAKEDLELTEGKQVSSYAHSELDATLPRQTLLVDRNKKMKK